MRRSGVFLVALAMTGCGEEPADRYVERVPLDEAQQFAAEPLPSPSVEGAIWVEVEPDTRLLYGIPGQTPMLALECKRGTGLLPSELVFTRFVRADAEAQALMALVGNFHVARIPVDATWNGRAWVWQGSIDPQDTHLEALTGPREVELTIPGAGTLKLGAGSAPGDLVNACRSDPSSATEEPVPDPSESTVPEPEATAPAS